MVSGHVVVPTAEPASGSGPARSRRPSAVLVAVAVALVVVWPSLPFFESPRTEEPSVLERPITAGAAAAGTGTSFWAPAVAVPDAVARVVGVGDAVLAVSPEELWPVAILRDDGWQRLLGLPVGFDLVPSVAVERPDGFSIVGTTADRTVLFDFRDDGRFTGARTLFGVVGDAVAPLGEAVVVFDVAAARGVVVADRLDDVTTPGTVTAAASDGGLLAVVLDDGSLHVSNDMGSTWTIAGSGFEDLLPTHPVVAVGETAGVGLHLVGDGFTRRLEDAPFGPAVAWDGRVAVHDWSTDSVWHLRSTGRWERVGLWTRHGFTDRFAAMVDAVETPAVMALDVDGRAWLWRVEA